MKFSFILPVVVFGCSAAQAQTVISFGPRLGFNASTSHYSYDRTFTTKYKPGGSVGVMAEARRGHLALQAAALYEQKGFRLDDEYKSGSDYSRQKDTYRLNYLTLPVQVVYTQHEDGQGVQILAGSYVGMLLNGQLQYDDYYQNRVIGELAFRGESKIKPASTIDYPSQGAYSQRFDAGVQAGVGYRYNNLLVQAEYSLGLRDLRPRYNDVNGNRFISPSYYNRVVQLSASYLFSITK
ncbi:porin family protein [Hymenobacter rigui]|uniref:PorT family protein n=1 Tax=Hymenobacter rigui TaxID=334424 RepID=A0A428KTG3_9BACT|nr:porin family protein [Hymenobacter rigui]RSK49830.1 PorT family protein [Hymenobacter rigui]